MIRRPSPRSALAALLASCILTGCGGGDDGGASAATVTTAPRPVTQSDLDIARNIYGAGPRAPNGFGADFAESHAHISTSHLKNSDVDAALAATSPLYELCSNDWNQALAWSEQHAQRGAYADLVETSDDVRFHEFGRVQHGEPERYRRTRVFKCTYLDRSSSDLNAAQGSAGRLNVRPVTAEELRKLSEYLWQFSPYNNFGHVVLQSSGTTTPTGFAHTLYIGSLAAHGVSACDRIDVVAWRHDADATSGALERSVETLWSFGAREEMGVAELCQ